MVSYTHTQERAVMTKPDVWKHPADLIPCVCVWPLVFYFKLWENHPAGHKHRAHTSAWTETQPAGTPKNTNRDSLRPVQESHHSIIQLLQCLSICELLLNKLVTRLGTAGVT